MANTILGNAFKDVADAIRAKGVTGTMSPLEMPAKVATIQTGKRKFGVSIDNLLGDTDQQGNLEQPSEPFSFGSLDILGIADYGMFAKFNYNNGITSLSLPNMTSIGNCGLYCVCIGSTSLRSVDLSGVVTVGDVVDQSNYSHALYAAFQECTALETLDLSSLTTIGSGQAPMQYLCDGCTSLRQVDLSSLTTISGGYGLQYAFQNCTSLASIDLSNITTIADYGLGFAFQGCTSLASIDLSNLTSMGGNALYQAFKGCTSLTRADLSGISTLSDGGLSSNVCRDTFNGCTSLVELDFSNLQSIGRAAQGMTEICKNCTALKRVYFTKLSSVNTQRTNTFQNAFNGCTSLELVDFSQATAVPALPGSTPFANTNETFKIVVPDALEATWKTTTGWSAYASHIISVSDYQNL